MSTPELTGAYDRAADGWGRTIDRLGFPNAYETTLRRILAGKGLKTDETPYRVLDCGIGTGAFSAALARVLKCPFALDGIDLSPAMLMQAERRLAEEGVCASLREGDVQALPYPDAGFDLVMAAHVLEHLSDPEIAMKEMVRVLKPGGLLITCLTRRTSLGMYIHLKWRTHWVTPEEAKSWLAKRNLERIRCLPFARKTYCRRMSFACVGRKPLA